MSLLKKLVGLTIGAAAVGAAAYFLNRNEHTEEYEHIWGPEDEADAEDGTAETAEPADDASAEAEEAPAAPEGNRCRSRRRSSRSGGRPWAGPRWR